MLQQLGSNSQPSKYSTDYHIPYPLPCSTVYGRATSRYIRNIHTEMSSGGCRAGVWHDYSGEYDNLRLVLYLCTYVYITKRAIIVTDLVRDITQRYPYDIL